MSVVEVIESVPSVYVCLSALAEESLRPMSGRHLTLQNALSWAQRRRCVNAGAFSFWRENVDSETVPALTHFPCRAFHIFARLTSFSDVTCHTVTSHDVMTSHHRPRFHKSLKSEKAGNFIFCSCDPDPWPSNSSEISSRSMPVPILVSIRQTNWPWERWLTPIWTDTLTTWSDSITSTADAGGKDKSVLSSWYSL